MSERNDDAIGGALIGELVPDSTLEDSSEDLDMLFAGGSGRLGTLSPGFVLGGVDWRIF